MTDRKLLRIGIIGSVVMAICCFTLILVILVVAVGLSAVVGWLDYVLFPALGIFVAIATGSSSYIPPIPGIGEVPYLTSASAVELPAISQHASVGSTRG